MRFYIDISDNAMMAADNVGSEHQNFEAARYEAIQTMLELTNHNVPNGEYREYGVTIRDEAGMELYRAELTFKGHRLAVRDQPVDLS